jgi:hypothetical protein
VPALEAATSGVHRAVLAGLATCATLLLWAPGAPASTWIAETLPQPPNSGNGHKADGVSCVQADHCIAVGNNWSLAVHTQVTLAELWNGTSWSVMATPNPPGLDEGWKDERYALLRSVSCVSTTDCVAVGYFRDTGEAVQPLTERWNGSDWTLVPPATPVAAVMATLENVSCTSASACTAVGYSESDTGAIETLAERWDGSKWSIEATPNPGGASGSRLLGVSCPTATTCTAVGFNHSVEAETTLAERWDGSKWLSQATVDPTGPSASNRLTSVSCVSASTCTAVGRHLHKLGTHFLWAPLAEQWNGSAWNLQSTPEPPESEEASLASISCVTSTSCTAVGEYRQIAGSDSFAEVLGERWNGVSWSVLPVAPFSDPPSWWHERWLFGVSCIATEACTAVGAGLSAPPEGLSPYRALGEHEVATTPTDEEGTTPMKDPRLREPNQPSNPQSPSNAFAVRHAATLCDGRIVLRLFAPDPGRFVADATAATVRARATAGLRAGRNCGPVQSRSHFQHSLDKRRGGHGFPYGRGAASALEGRPVELTIVPRRDAFQTTRSGSFLVRIAITFTPQGGDPLTRHKTLLVRR